MLSTAYDSNHRHQKQLPFNRHHGTHILHLHPLSRMSEFPVHKASKDPYLTLLVNGAYMMISLDQGLVYTFWLGVGMSISPDLLKNILESATAMWCEVTAHRQSSFGQ